MYKLYWYYDSLYHLFLTIATKAYSKNHLIGFV